MAARNYRGQQREGDDRKPNLIVIIEKLGLLRGYRFGGRFSLASGRLLRVPVEVSGGEGTERSTFDFVVVSTCASESSVSPSSPSLSCFRLLFPIACASDRGNN